MIITSYKNKDIFKAVNYLVLKFFLWLAGSYN